LGYADGIISQEAMDTLTVELDAELAEVKGSDSLPVALPPDQDELDENDLA
jgi:hypothetical protein